MTSTSGGKKPSSISFHPVLQEIEQLLNGFQSSLGTERKALQQEVVRTVFAIERKLQDALNGEGLRGTKNLLISKVPLWAWNIRKSNKMETIEFPPPGQEADVLVLLRDGSISVANVQREEGQADRAKIHLELFEPDDEDIHVEDLVPFVQTVFVACEHHWVASEKTAASTQKIDRLVQAIRESLVKANV